MPTKRHFHTIDALRFFAFFKVFLQHTPIQGDFPIFNYLKNGGGLGVSFFFVLSGFLITYLLVWDKWTNGQVKPKKFMIRRIFRIWPLFFLGVLIAFLLPYELKQSIGFHMVGGGYEFDWRFSFTFLENYNMLMMDNFPKTTPLSVFWSLCIEEHFYIVWMVLLFSLPKQYILKFLLFSIPFAWLGRWLEPQIWNNHRMYEIDFWTTIDLFAIGGILGYMVTVHYEKVIRFVENIPLWLQRLLVIAVISMVIFEDHIIPDVQYSNFNIIRNSIIGVAFTSVLLLVVPNKAVIRIDSKILNYLGQISYGLYVYHIMVIHIAFKYCIAQQIQIDDIWTLSSFMIVTFGLSVLISSLSYHYFERYFLNLRERLTG